MGKRRWYVVGLAIFFFLVIGKLLKLTFVALAIFVMLGVFLLYLFKNKS
ncbi:hypothetical protein [Thermoactinomyces sp. DSM 45892]|nr:hypothetical protein [Thermoactinomyces sp. DSM 45892]SDZ13821.1 hypothetical protein SAMN05444416_11466 [Thermoactinomyces sp. DSM 45892]